jgi:hypothetical protein
MSRVCLYLCMNLCLCLYIYIYICNCLVKNVSYMCICVNLIVCLGLGLRVLEYVHTVCFLSSDTKKYIKFLLFNAFV